MRSTGRVKDPEPLAVTAKDVAAILRDCGGSDEQIAAFCGKCGKLFGEDAVLSPANLIDSKRFEVKTADAAISIDPEHSYLVETRVIDGKKYLLIPAGRGWRSMGCRWTGWINKYAYGERKAQWKHVLLTADKIQRGAAGWQRPCFDL